MKLDDIPAPFQATRSPGEWVGETPYGLVIVRRASGRRRDTARCYQGAGGEPTDYPCGSLSQAFAVGVRWLNSQEPAEARRTLLSWIPLSECLPDDQTFVLMTGPSGYSTTPNFVVLACRDMQYRPPIDGRIRWLDPTHTPLLDKGWEPTHWARIALPPHVSAR